MRWTDKRVRFSVTCVPFSLMLLAAGHLRETAGWIASEGAGASSTYGQGGRKKRSQMLPGDSEAIERRKVSRIASRLHVELRADAPDEFRRAAFRRKHPGQKKQIARLHRFFCNSAWVQLKILLGTV
jgi:hypothetical protein